MKYSIRLHYGKRKKIDFFGWTIYERKILSFNLISKNQAFLFQKYHGLSFLRLNTKCNTENNDLLSDSNWAKFASDSIFLGLHALLMLQSITAQIFIENEKVLGINFSNPTYSFAFNYRDLELEDFLLNLIFQSIKNKEKVTISCLSTCQFVQAIIGKVIGNEEREFPEKVFVTRIIDYYIYSNENIKLKKERKFINLRSIFRLIVDEEIEHEISKSYNMTVQSINEHTADESFSFLYTTLKNEIAQAFEERRVHHSADISD